MILKGLLIHIITRVLLITANSLVLVYSFLVLNDVFTIANLAVLLIIQTVLLIHYLNKSNRDLENFFSSINHDDTTIVFKKHKNPGSYKRLYEHFDNTNSLIQKIKILKAEQHSYFKMITEHSGAGLISFDRTGKVEIFNKAAKEILGISEINNISKLDSLCENFSESLIFMKPSEEKLFKIKSENEILQLFVKATEIRLINQKVKLISFQNIRNELEEKELDSWQKLIRVLTHEIMNSVGPIASTITTLRGFLTKDKKKKPKLPEELSANILANTVKGLDIIGERSEGLMEFVKKYRDLTIIPHLSIKKFSVKELFNGIILLMDNKIKEESVNIEIDVEPVELQLMADKKLVEQTLINLIDNSLYFFSDTKNKKLRLKAISDMSGTISISVIDNGKGISDENLEKIFIPFYSTKGREDGGELSGSGIGLSLSRQIMRKHNGSIRAHSIPGVETVFSLRF